MRRTFLETLKQKAKKNGWTYERTKNNHWKFFSPNGENIVVVAGTPSDWRAQRKIYAEFKKAGLDMKSND